LFFADKLHTHGEIMFDYCKDTVSVVSGHEIQLDKIFKQCCKKKAYDSCGHNMS